MTMVIKDIHMQMPAGEFKAKCLQLMDEVQKSHKEVIITKFGKPVAKLVPFTSKPREPVFGFLKDSMIIKEDIVQSTGEKWDADE